MSKPQLAERATIEFERGVSEECERCQLSKPTHAFVVTGNAGVDGVAVYCDTCSQTYAERHDAMTYLGSIEVNE